jgi:hypothetical protein
MAMRGWDAGKASKLSPGVRVATSSISLIRACFTSSAPKAVTVTGTSCRRSLRRCAVTTISSIETTSDLLATAGAVCAIAWPAPIKAAVAAPHARILRLVVITHPPLFVFVLGRARASNRRRTGSQRSINWMQSIDALDDVVRSHFKSGLNFLAFRPTSQFAVPLKGQH